MTFLFTDIEGSTRLWETARDDMTAALQQHDVLLRGAIDAHDGYVFSTGGDGFGAAFARAEAAVAAALDAQTALATAQWSTPSPLRVRMGLHTGEAAERDGDYFGPVVNRTARLMATAHGGQVVCSRTTAEIAGSGFSLRDLGEHRLRDLLAPQRVFQVGDGRFPPLRTVDSVPSNLPTMVTDLIGRSDDVEAYTTALKSCRLLTLTGAGGVGKTRLALAVAAAVATEFPDGAWFVPFGPVRDATDVVRTVVEALRAPATVTGRASLAEYLAERHLVVVLDNCEHLLDEVAAVANAVLRTTADVTLISTSREPLGVDGEVVRRVTSLPTAIDGDLAAIAASPAVRLFVERAQAADDRFRLTAGNADAVARICRQLDGIPLALELAAGRTRTMRAEEMADLLHERFRLLGGGRRAEERQRTLLATVQWSHDLLSEQERVVFRRLAVFPASFDAHAARAVAAGEDLDPFDVLDDLLRLVERSLVQHDPETGRYRLLETLRQYAADRLAEAGETDACRDRHAAHYVTTVERMDLAHDGARYREHRAQLLHDLDNIRATIERLRETHQWEDVHRLCDAGEVCLGNTVTQELLDWWCSAFGHGAPADPRQRLAAMGAASVHAGSADWPTCDRLTDRCDRLAAELGLPRHPASLMGRGLKAWFRGELDDSRHALEEALLGCRALDGKEHLEIGILGTLLNVEQAAGRADASATYIGATLDIARRTGHPALSWIATTTTAGAYVFASDPPRSQEVLELFRAHHIDAADADPHFAAWLSTEASLARCGLGGTPPVREAVAAVRIADAAGIAHALAVALETTALAAAQAGRSDVTARLVGYVDAHLAEHRGNSPGHQWLARQLAAATGALPVAEQERLRAEGAAMGRKELMALLRELEAVEP